MDDRAGFRRRKRGQFSTAKYPKRCANKRARGGEYTFLIVTVIGSILLVLVLLFVWYSQATGKANLGPPESVPDPLEPQPPSPSKLLTFSNAAVCTDGQSCSIIGSNILKKGGNAVDAVIAALFCNGIVNSQSMGIGGGFMMTLYMNKTGYSVTARETAPQAAYRDMFLKNPQHSRTGGLAVGVPGELVGYWEVWKKFGSLSWSELLQPSIELCHRGYHLSKPQYDSIFFRPNIFDNDPVFREIFLDKNTGDWYRPGSLIKPQQICETLKVIATEGGMALNNGSLTKGFVDDVQERQGILTEDDMRNYRVEWSDPVKFTLNNGYTVYSAPPPASGLLLAYILQILDGYNIKAPYTNVSEASTPQAIQSYVKTLHRVIESYKFAFAQRDRLADPKYVNINQVTNDLLSKVLAAETRQKIHDNETFDNGEFYGSVTFTKDDHGTAHLSVISPTGDAVSVTSTINLYFGAGFVSKTTGILPNSVMDDFSSPGAENFFNLKPSVNNLIEPGKRPLSSACPTIVTDSNGQAILVLGASGGTKIPTAISWVMLRYLWFNEDIKEAVDASRIHHQLFPMKMEYEYGLTQPLVEGLKKLGHKPVRYRYRGSVVCAISKSNSTISANADFRKGGEVSGF